ncbi:hypothetical protein FHS23_001054 [Prauserella isguenensis]|uniref:Uncharacterized protein n=1 Tax=Prauserella isguenensis TaxID=1470180 RepID=A0A839RZQ8_9PSEU|nr:hypothetical protein [Prauserella isguenensis]MBB3050059.1 hypothetical protein [Prauserella isguenensis]
MWIPGLLTVVAVGGCGSSGPTCTAIGSPPGISVHGLESPAGTAPGGTVPTAGTPTATGDDPASGDMTVEACWDGTCREYEVSRHRSSDPRRGFAEIRELPTEPVRVTLVADGRRLGPVTVVPEPVRPNGDDCPAFGPAASVTVDRHGTVHPG